VNTNVIQPIVSGWNWLWDVIVNVATAIWNGIVSVWSAIAAWVDTWIIQPIVNGWNWLQQAVANIVTAVWNTITSIWATIANWVDTYVIQPISNLWDGLVSTATRVVQGIYDGFTSVLGSLASWFDNNVIKPIEDGWNRVRNFFSGIGEGIEEGWKYITNIGKSGSFDPNIDYSKVPGADTGGYIPKEGLVNLHPGEVVVNHALTRRLERFLESQDAEPVYAGRLGTSREITRELSRTVEKESDSGLVDRLDQLIALMAQFANRPIQASLSVSGREIATVVEREQNMRRDRMYSRG